MTQKEKILLQFSEKKYADIGLNTVKEVTDNLTSVRKTYDKLEPIVSKFINLEKSMSDLRNEFKTQLSTLKGDVNNVNASSKELVQKAKDLGLDNPPIATNAPKIAADFLSKSQNLLKRIN
jgi:uncharacterized coiled-coil DUF342 family protein